MNDKIILCKCRNFDICYSKGNPNHVFTSLVSPFIVKTLENSLKSSTSWYTGISIKEFITTNILSQSDIIRQDILSGKWSAYAHFSPAASIKNLLLKSGYTSGDVVIDSLVPEEIIQFCDNYNFKIMPYRDQTLEYSKEYNPSKPLILTVKNGDTSYINSFLDSIKTPQVRVFLIIDSGVLTRSLVELSQHPVITGCVFIIDNIFTIFSPANQDNLSYFPTVAISYFIEPRVTSTLEYHLSESKDQILPFITHLYNSYSSTQKGLNSWINLQYQKSVYGIGKQDFSKQVVNLWNSLYLVALPDVLFQIITTKKKQLDESVLVQNKKNIYDFFIQEIKRQPQGTLMLPKQNSYDISTRLLLFTTDKDGWVKKLSDNNYNIYPVTTLNKNDFMSKYGLLIDLY